MAFERIARASIPILLFATTAASCQVISGLGDIVIGGDGGAGAGAGAGAAPGGFGGTGSGIGGGGGGGEDCEPGRLDRNRDRRDGCEYLAPIPTASLALWLSGDYGISTDADDGVSAWLDQSSRRNDFRQELPLKRPILSVAALNDLSALLFGGDAPKQRLNSTNYFLGDFSSGFTFLGVVRRDVQGERDTIFDMVVAGGEHDGSNIYLSQRNADDDMWFGSTAFGGANAVVTNSGAYTPNAAHLISIVVVGEARRFRYDGITVAETPQSLAPQLPETDQLSAVLGANVAEETQPFHQGLIAELIMYERGLDDGELTAVEQYLQTKWDCCN